MSDPWTFDRLVRADRPTLERVLLASEAAEPRHLAGLVYDGYNHDWLGQSAGKKFRKAFVESGGVIHGLNQIIEPDSDGAGGVWRLKTENGRPVEMGYFRILPASEAELPRSLARYRHLTFFDYNISRNPRGSLMVRAVRDYVGLPNAGDHGLILGKAYLRLASFLYAFASYFILTRPTPYSRSHGG